MERKKINRAAIFAPFDALKGLQEALKEREARILKEERIELSEEQQLKISETMHSLKKGMIIEVEFYFNGRYIKVQGKLTQVNGAFKTLTLGENKLAFGDIVGIKVIKQ